MRRGDAAALSMLYDRYWEDMSLYVLKITQSYEDAADIVQDIFITLWKRRSDLAIRGALRPYLMTAVRNRSIRYIQNNMNQQRFLSGLSAHYKQLAPAAGHDRHLEARELEEQLTSVVSRLPSRMREVFILSRKENLTNKEIAARLNIAETTVKKQVSNALKVLRIEAGILSLAIVLLGIIAGIASF